MVTPAARPRSPRLDLLVARLARSGAPRAALPAGLIRTGAGRAALIVALALALVGVPYGIGRLVAGGDGPQSWTEAGAPQWSDEPSAVALAAAADRGRPGRAEQFYFVLPDRFANGDPRNDTRRADRRPARAPATTRPTRASTTAATCRASSTAWTTSRAWAPPRSGSPRSSRTGRCRAAATTSRPATTATGSPTSPRSTRTSAPTPTCSGWSSSRTGAGIKIYLDIIVNHTADVIRYAENRYAYIDKATSPYVDAQGRAFEDRNYADGSRGFPKVNAGSFPYTPVFAGPADAKVKEPAWLNDPTMYHNRGDSTFAGENSEYGDFFGLDDLWTERPEVVAGHDEDLRATGSPATGIDGFRLDTVKHTNLDFWPQFSQGIDEAAAQGRQAGLLHVRRGLQRRPGGRVDATCAAAACPPPWTSPSRRRPRGRSPPAAAPPRRWPTCTPRTTSTPPGTPTPDRLPTFLGNHDMGRIGSFIARRRHRPGHPPAPRPARPRADVPHPRPAGGLLRRRAGLHRPGRRQGRPAGHVRHQVGRLPRRRPARHRPHPRGRPVTTPSHPLYRAIAALGALRKAHPALPDGMQVTRYAADGPGVFAISRIDPRRRASSTWSRSNNATTAQTVTLDTWSPSATFAGSLRRGRAPRPPAPTAR